MPRTARGAMSRISFNPGTPRNAAGYAAAYWQPAIHRNVRYTDRPNGTTYVLEEAAPGLAPSVASRHP